MGTFKHFSYHTKTLSFVDRVWFFLIGMPLICAHLNFENFQGNISAYKMWQMFNFLLNVL